MKKMDRIDREQLYNTCWKHWGAEAQADMLIEEMAELTLALLKARRYGTFYTYAVSEEMADVLICLEQFEVRMKAFPTTCTKDDKIEIVGCVYDQVEQIKEAKLQRLKERLMESLARKHDLEDVANSAMDKVR